MRSLAKVFRLLQSTPVAAVPFAATLNVEPLVAVAPVATNSMRLQIISDMHLEFGNPGLEHHQVLGDTLVLAGDIGWVPHLRSELPKAAKRWSNIVYITGNHEYYDTDRTMAEVNSEIEDIVSTLDNVWFLNNSTTTIDGIRFVGSTLWSTPVSEARQNDFVWIAECDLKSMHQWNATAQQFLKDTVRPDDVVVTHFLPVIRSDLAKVGVVSKYPTGEWDYYYGNTGLESVQAQLWICGHTHEPFDAVPFETRCVCNPLGYPDENTTTFTELVIDVQ